jgi:hypothetical protein
MRICVMSPVFNDAIGCAQSAAKDREDYCAIHGYANAAHQADPGGLSNYPASEKYAAIRYLLSSCDGVLWMDSDRFIMNFAFGLEPFFDDSAEIILSRERGEIDGGALLFKNTSAVFGCLENARIESELTSEPSTESGALRSVLNRMNALQVRCFPQSTLSSDFKSYTRGDFLLRLTDGQNFQKFAESIFAEGSLTLEEKEQFPYMFNSLGYRGQGAIVGVGRGDFADAVMARWKGSTMFLIDPWRNPSNCNLKPYLGDEILDVEHDHVQKWFASYSTTKIIRETAIRAAEQFAPQCLDWLYFDGAHTRNFSTDDVLAWLPKLRRGGILAGREHANWTLLKRPVEDSIPGKIAREMGGKLRLTAEVDGPSWYFVKNWE